MKDLRDLGHSLFLNLQSKGIVLKEEGISAVIPRCSRLLCPSICKRKEIAKETKF
jgi:hypothetical protein